MSAEAISALRSKFYWMKHATMLRTSSTLLNNSITYYCYALREATEHCLLFCNRTKHEKKRKKNDLLWLSAVVVVAPRFFFFWELPWCGSFRLEAALYGGRITLKMYTNTRDCETIWKHAENTHFRNWPKILHLNSRKRNEKKITLHISSGGYLVRDA